MSATTEATILRAGRETRDGRRGFAIRLAVGEAVAEVFLRRGSFDDARRAAEFLEALGVDHTSPTPSDYAPPRRVGVRVRPAPAGADEPPRVIGFGDGVRRFWTDDEAALDALTGDRRRRRPENVAAAARAAKRLDPRGEVHHRVPRRAGGTDHRRNLDPMAEAAHAAEERRRAAEERAVGVGLRTAVVLGADRCAGGGWGVALDVRHPRTDARHRVYAWAPDRVEVYDADGVRIREAPRLFRELEVWSISLEPGDRRFRYRIGAVADPDDAGGVDRLRARIIWGAEEAAS